MYIMYTCTRVFVVRVCVIWSCLFVCLFFLHRNNVVVEADVSEPRLATSPLSISAVPKPEVGFCGLQPFYRIL